MNTLHIKKQGIAALWLAALVAGLGLAGLASPLASGDTQQSGSIGIQGVIPSPPPSRGPTIAVPGNGAVFTSEPVTVSGLCPTGLLIKLFDNNVFVGSVICSNGSYSLQIDLFSGQNELVAKDFDALDQSGPVSNTVIVTFNDAQFLNFGTHVQLSSSYAERGAAPGSELDWPVLLSDGTGPYAISVDWGDGTSPDLMSIQNPGPLTLKHIYRVAGVYKVIVKASDKNSGEAFLQLVGQATGAIQSNTNGGKGSSELVRTEIIWWPGLVMLPLILASFWIGRRHELYSLRKSLEKAREQ